MQATLLEQESLGEGHGLLDRLAQAVVFGTLALIAIRFRNYQWDLQMFRGSAEDFVRGVDPYRGIGLSFFHPPITLYFYRFLLWMPRPLAYELWLTLKIAALGGLFSIWGSVFAALRWDWKTVLYFVFGYNAAISCDLFAGNVSVFEQLGLWLAFSSLLKGSYPRFCLFVILVAQVKLTPIFFASLLLVVPERPKWSWFFGCLGGFCALFALNFVLEPTLVRRFFAVSSMLDERSDLANISTLGLIRDVLEHVMGPQAAARTRLDEAVFVLLSLIVGVSSLVSVLRHRRFSKRQDDEEQSAAKLIIYFSCAVLTIVSPRMKVYSYILLLIPTWHLLWALPVSKQVSATAFALAAIVVFPLGNSSLPLRTVFRFLYMYMPLLSAFVVWFCFKRVLDGKMRLTPVRSRS